MTPQSTTRTLPAPAYHAPEHYRAECERIFRKEWLLVASATQLREPGDYMALDLVGEPIVVVRGGDGALRALSSVCRHRYMLVTEYGRGRADRLTCPYHLWQYELDGRLTSAPFMSGVGGFDRSTHGLPSFPLEEWEGLVFVSLDPEPPPLAPRLEPVREALARYRMATARQVAFYDQLWNCNWKVAVENASECYHHVGTHRELLNSVLPARGTYGCTGTPHFAVHRTPAEGDSDWGIAPHDIDVGLLPEDLAEMAVFTIFPSTLVLNAGPLVLWFSVLPEGVDRCRFLNGFLAPAVLADAGLVDEEAINRFMNTVNAQDLRIVELVQRGVTSSHARPGLLSHKEPALVDFYAYLRRCLSASGSRAPY